MAEAPLLIFVLQFSFLFGRPSPFPSPPKFNLITHVLREGEGTKPIRLRFFAVVGRGFVFAGGVVGGRVFVGGYETVACAADT